MGDGPTERMDQRWDTGEADLSLSRRAFVIHVGAAAALLGAGVPAQAQTAPAAVPRQGSSSGAHG